MSDEKLQRMLEVIHEENKLIMTAVLKMGCNQIDYERLVNKTLDAWDAAFKEITDSK